MKAHIQAQAVLGQLLAQGVGRRPGHILAGVNDRHRDDLLEDGDADEGQRHRQQHANGCAAQGGIDEVAHHLRVDDLQADAAQQ